MFGPSQLCREEVNISCSTHQYFGPSSNNNHLLGCPSILRSPCLRHLQVMLPRHLINFAVITKLHSFTIIPCLYIKISTFRMYKRPMLFLYWSSVSGNAPKSIACLWLPRSAVRRSADFNWLCQKCSGANCATQPSSPISSSPRQKLRLSSAAIRCTTVSHM